MPLTECPLHLEEYPIGSFCSQCSQERAEEQNRNLESTDEQQNRENSEAAGMRFLDGYSD